MMNIKTPTFLVDEIKCRGNINKMVTKAKAAKADLKPHFKTHQSNQIAEWFREAGITGCTVSSVTMAQYFASHGWKDITIAFPYNPLEIEEVNALAKKVNLNILLESKESQKHVLENLQHKVGFYIKVDVGTHRTGLDHRDKKVIRHLVEHATDKLKFQGFYAHSGHTYGTSNLRDLEWIFKGTEKMMIPLKDEFGGVLSFGDTPSCSIIEDLSAYDELRPGNFAFYDWMQHEIGSCTFKEIAVCVACPIVALHPEREEAVLYGGAVHLSKDRIGKESISYGKVVKLTESGWSEEIIGNVARISQEHGIVQLPIEILAHFKVGDTIGIIPVHSCLTANLQGHYLSTKGDRIDKHIKN